MIIEIKTSSEILHECAENVRKRLPSILSSEYENRKWINMDDLLGYLDDINNFQSPALIHVQTIIDLIESHSKNSRSSDEDSLDKDLTEFVRKTKNSRGLIKNESKNQIPKNIS